MPVTVEEKFGRTLSDDRAERTYVILGAADEIEARDELESAAPATLDGKSQESAEVDELHIPGGGAFMGRVTWVADELSAPVLEVGETSVSFDTTGGTQHITQSLSTISTHAVTGSAPDSKGAIGSDGEKVQGVSITAPTYKFTESHVKTASEVDTAYKAVVFGLTGKVNNGAFKGFASGEVLFLGASGQQRGNAGDYDITYHFASSPNKTGLTVGAMTLIDKKGWEYLWVYYRPVKDDTAKAVIQQPYAAYVEKVYEEGDFSGLGI